MISALGVIDGVPVRPPSLRTTAGNLRWCRVRTRSRSSTSSGQQEARLLHGHVPYGTYGVCVDGVAYRLDKVSGSPAPGRYARQPPRVSDSLAHHAPLPKKHSWTSGLSRLPTKVARTVASCLFCSSDNLRTLDLDLPGAGGREQRSPSAGAYAQGLDEFQAGARASVIECRVWSAVAGQE
jgi:hypothetical protein